MTIISTPERHRYRNAILKDSPIAYWRMNDDGTGFVTDIANDYVSGNHLQFSLGPAADLAHPPLIRTDYGDEREQVCVNFNGDGAAYNSTLPVLTNAFTLEAWFMLYGLTPAYQQGLGRVHPTNTWNTFGFFCFFNNTNALVRFSDGNGNDIYTTSTTTITTLTKYHMVGTMDGVNLKLYINGVEESSVPAGTGTVVSHSGSEELAVGHGYLTGAKVDYLNGAIDEVAIYDYALTPTQIQNHYSLGS